jgi:acyl-coenzyme A thioesterase PaaI-like protein
VNLNTHLQINNKLNGEVLALQEGYAKVSLVTTEEMVADERGLIHGGFTFGSADFCAMAAVNDPYVVLAKSEVKFLAPTFLGDTIVFEGNIIETNKNKRLVKVIGSVDNKEVFSGEFLTVILEKHIRDI